MMDLKDTEEVIEGPPLKASETVVPGYEAIVHLHLSNNVDLSDAWSDEQAHL
jgi:hypothetical protein